MSKKQTPEEYLSAYPPPMAELANRLRALVKKTIPQVTEIVYPGWKIIGLRVQDGKRTAHLGFIQACSDHVHLGFEYGILIPDPKKLLQGHDLKQVRFLTVRRPSEIRAQDFAKLIRGAHAVSINKNKRTLLRLEQDARKVKP